MILTVFVVWLIIPSRWVWTEIYVQKFDVSWNDVEWNREPQDCDWGRSPLGSKGCHYNRQVTAYNFEGQPVGGDNAPQYVSDATGNTKVSFDNGKTWKWASDYGTVPNIQAAKVVVDWEKVSED
jgi:hypothetical protein